MDSCWCVLHFHFLLSSSLSLYLFPRLFYLVPPVSSLSGCELWSTVVLFSFFTSASFWPLPYWSSWADWCILRKEQVRTCLIPSVSLSFLSFFFFFLLFNYVREALLQSVFTLVNVPIPLFFTVHPIVKEWDSSWIIALRRWNYFCSTYLNLS